MTVLQRGLSPTNRRNLLGHSHSGIQNVAPTKDTLGFLDINHTSNDLHEEEKDKV